MNLVLIVADSLRGDSLGYMGHKNNTPNIDSLAKESRVYTEAYSMGSLTRLSSPYLVGDKALSSIHRRWKNPVLLHTNPLFEVFKPKLKRIDVGEDEPTQWRRILSYLRGKTYAPYRRASNLNKIAVRTIEEFTEPFFLCLWYMDTHLPYLPPVKMCLTDRLKASFMNRELIKSCYSGIYDFNRPEVRYLRGLYNKEIECFDSALGELLPMIPDDTCIVFTSDHGEGFMENGYMGHPEGKPEIRHVPLLVKHPDMPHEVHDYPMNHGQLYELLRCG